MHVRGNSNGATSNQMTWRLFLSIHHHARHQPHLRTSLVPPTAVLDAAYHPPLALLPPLATRAPGCTRKHPTHAAQATTREDDNGMTRGRHKRTWGERRKVSTPLHHALLVKGSVFGTMQDTCWPSCVRLARQTKQEQDSEVQSE